MSGAVRDARVRALRFSIVVATDGRAGSLAETLCSLQYLDGPDFEVCVVRGPTEDGTADVLAHWRGAIKVTRNDRRNLSISRNLGIALAAGNVVALIDDDAVPEPAWLQDLAAPYANPRVGGVGGFVYDPTGKEFQYRFATVDRLGEPNLAWSRPAPDLCFPFTANFPHLMGTNASFRRDAILDVGGFDEEFDYYLDETDLCCRLVDHGWTIRQLDRAFVHHRFLPSPIRNCRAVIHDWYPILKNKLYFSFVNGRAHHGVPAIIESGRSRARQMRENVEWAIRESFLHRGQLKRFDAEIALAWKDGLARGLRGIRRLPTSLAEPSRPFLPFPSLMPAGGRRTIVVLGTEHDERALALARLGHHVHLVAGNSATAGVSFENGVWKHRVRDEPAVRPSQAAGLSVSDDLWNRSAAMLREVDEISRKASIDRVFAPACADEGAAFYLDGRFPLSREPP